MAPKNDKARKAWLAGLKDCEVVAVVDDSGALLEVFPVSRRANIEAFWVSCFGSFTLTTGRGKGRSGGAIGATWIVPTTESMKAKYAARRNADRGRGKLQAVDRINGWREFSDEQILAVTAILWPDAK